MKIAKALFSLSAGHAVPFATAKLNGPSSVDQSILAASVETLAGWKDTGVLIRAQDKVLRPIDDDPKPLLQFFLVLTSFGKLSFTLLVFYWPQGMRRSFL